MTSKLAGGGARPPAAPVLWCRPAMIQIIAPATLATSCPRLERLFQLSAAKIRAIERTWKPEDGAPVFTN